MKVKPEEFGLPAKTNLEMAGEGTVAIVIARKNKIILADGKRVVEKAQTIKRAQPQMSVVLKTTAKLCGDVRRYLQWEGIDVIEVH